VLKGATARRYAEAVFELGVQEETIERWRDDLRLLAEYLGNRRLAFVLKEPKIPFQRKELIVRDLLGERVRREALNLAMLLVERGLVELAPRISEQFEKLYNDYRGQAIAQVTTAIPLDDTLRTQVARDLQQITGKRIILQERVDPSILGGVVARVGDTLIDGSLKRRFALLRQQIISGALPLDGAAADGHVGPAPETGPAGATDTAPRPGDAPHLGPRPDQPGDQPPSPGQGPGRPGNGRPGDGRSGGRSKRRR
jgi:F-type H+-transporting ATPase subunit delta